jgi:streptogramin lyase
MKIVRRIFVSIPLAAALAIAAGCGSTKTPATTPVEPSGGAAFSGTVIADGKPVSGASVQIYAAGTNGNGSAGTALSAEALTTDSSGSFNVPSGYDCASSTTQVYLVARGGNPGSGSGADNNALAMMAALGDCSGIASGTTVMVNEVTTVAAVAALGAFYAPGGNIGAASTNATGLANAFLVAGNLANVSTGTAPGAALPPTLAVSSSKLNTLANALTACAAIASDCGPLFAAATPAGGAAPSNTLDAAWSIARHPANNVAAVYAIAVGSTLFSPALSAAPPDWMLYLALTGGDLGSPTTIGVNSGGTVWAADYVGAISAFSPAGVPLATDGFTGGGLNESFGLAVDSSNRIWVTNEQSPGAVNSGLGTLTELSATGELLSGGSGIFPGLISFPYAIAADSNGNMWIANYFGSTVTLLNSSGVSLSGSNGWGSGSVQLPVAIAVDASHNAWVANNANNTISKVTADGSQAITVACCDIPGGIATDQSGYVWVANYAASSVSQVSTGGTVVSSGYTGGGLDHPSSIAVDGAGTVWVANYRGNSISELAGSTASSPGEALSPSSGFGTDAPMEGPFGIAVDASGNLWLSGYINNVLVEFAGAAVPVRTPVTGPPQAP